MTFPSTRHLLSGIRGPLSVDGGTGGIVRTLTNAVILPGEINTPPFGIGQQPSEALQVDVLNIYDDGSLAGGHGDLTSTTLTGFGMGEAVSFDPAAAPSYNPAAGTSGTTTHGEPLTFPGGISYGSIRLDAQGRIITSGSTTTIEVLNLLLGQGNDTLTIHSTMIPGADQAIDDKLPTGIPALHGGLTVVHGGGNALLQVVGTFGVGPDSITRTDGHSWAQAGFAVGDRVTVPGYAAGAFTVVGFSGVAGETMRLTGPALTPGLLGSETAKATVSVYDANSAFTGFVRVGGDRIVVTDEGGGQGAGTPGPLSPLVIYGDTSQDGAWYSGATGTPSGHVFDPSRPPCRPATRRSTPSRSPRPTVTPATTSSTPPRWTPRPPPCPRSASRSTGARATTRSSAARPVTSSSVARATTRSSAGAATTSSMATAGSPST